LAGSGKTPGSSFLTARWEHLILANYRVDDALLRPLLPAGTELDHWQGESLVSLVGFQFLDTRLRGVPVPGHRHFEEVNLRFYVRRRGPDGDVRRAVVFIREIVPKLAVATIARWTYNEPYITAAMSHDIDCDAERGGLIRYEWTRARQHFVLEARVAGAAAPLTPGSEAQFITEHYWGYTRQRDGGTLEYEVEHPPWLTWTPTEFSFRGPAADLYGESFGAVLAGDPRSVFVAVGSAVSVRAGVRVV
jgi:uncharacterized protein YqjF (DUF2071 family)